MTNSQLTDLRTLILSEVGDFFAVVGSPGEPETPEEMQRELSMRLGRILNNHIVNYPRCEVLVEILHECRTARDEAQAELQELRRSYLALRGENEDLQAQLYEAENRGAAELLEHRKVNADLTMWVKRLGYSLKRAKPDSKSPGDAMAYLSAKGLISVEDILR